MAAIASWYNNQYSAWNRTRRIHAPTYLARVDTNTSRTAAALRNTDNNGNSNANDVVINMGELLPPGVADKKENKDTLFGPSIGLVGAAPAWCCEPEEERRKDGGTTGSGAKREKGDISDGSDELTPDVVKEWVRRSAESTEPTTTLQALVNLKRPTIRLSPLALPATASASALSPADASLPNHNSHTQQHGLEFEFDCDAPRCVISLHVVGVPAHLGIGDDHDQRDYAHSREALTTDAAATDTGDRLHLFEATVDGGFAQKLKLSAGAVLELARLEAAARVYRRARIAADTIKSGATSKPVDGSTEGKTDQGVDGARAADAHARKRLLFFRKKGNSHSNSNGDSAAQSTQAATATAGPALAVVDAESATPRHQQQETGSSLDSGAVESGSGDKQGDGKSNEEAEDEGVKVAIRLSARDADGRPLRVRNDQVTYLHVVRHGPVPAPIVGSHDSGSEGASASAAGAGVGAETGEAGTGADSEVEDTRPWVVKVVKREARIGPHSFHLHEIYGLTAHSTAAEHAHTIAPAAAPPNSTDSTTGAHTYPPTATAAAGVIPAVAGDADADVTAECLVCLSAPREVVLLPCRHLVACRECAVNMVEFGAGGNVVQAEGDTGAAGGPSGSATGSGGAAGDANASAGAGTEGGANAEASAPAPAPSPPAQTRRKRKAKGWFCPVCRQPYTSLLRITTAPPPSAKAGGVHGGNGGGADEDGKRVSLASSLEPEAEPEHPLADAPVLAHTPVQEMATTPVVPTSEQDLGTARSGFLRHFTGATAAANGNTNGNGNGNVEQMV
ncbi:hypothetical protein M0805_008558 [Coniferiporia weirii]|nr:hypothetical protein M0805_008558 [Coniferiporia weirii]